MQGNDAVATSTVGMSAVWMVPRMSATRIHRPRSWPGSSCLAGSMSFAQSVSMPADRGRARIEPMLGRTRNWVIDDAGSRRHWRGRYRRGRRSTGRSGPVPQTFSPPQRFRLQLRGFLCRDVFPEAKHPPSPVVKTIGAPIPSCCARSSPPSNRRCSPASDDAPDIHARSNRPRRPRDADGRTRCLPSRGDPRRQWGDPSETEARRREGTAQRDLRLRSVRRFPCMARESPRWRRRGWEERRAACFLSREHRK